MIRTFFLFMILIVEMIIFLPPGILALPLSLIRLKKASSMLVYCAAKLWACSIVALSGCKISVNGIENIPKTGGLCIVSNHSGYMDIMLLLAYAGRPLGFMAKKELSFIPVISVWILLMGGHFIDRKHPRKALKAIKRGIKHIKSGGTMIIFPEGTRSKGRGLLPFHPGSFKLAQRSNSPILPVAISGSYEIFEKYGRLNPCDVSISFGKPILPSILEQNDNKNSIADSTRNIIAGMLEKQC